MSSKSERSHFALPSRARADGGEVSRESGESYSSGLGINLSNSATAPTFPHSGLNPFMKRSVVNVVVPHRADVIVLSDSSDDELISKSSLKKRKKPEKGPRRVNTSLDKAQALRAHEHFEFKTSSKKRFSAAVSAASFSPFKQDQARKLPANVKVVNDVDTESLPSDFEFVEGYVFRNGTGRIDAEFRSGCTCGEQNGRNVGCEYVQKCDCLQDVATNDDGRRIGFPYHVEGEKRGCLQGKYLNTRFMIYECSNLCNCGPNCRNKVVQWGRQIPLEIFRTRDRGWGLRSPVAINKGRFIDTYRGEVITSQEADAREERSRLESRGNNKDSYLFGLDKFADEIPPEDQYVVDGEFMGGPVRFVNHSCQPNCAIFAVSTTRGDAKVYELALFALEDIPARRELNFDYVGDDDHLIASQQEVARAVARDQSGKLATRCLCGGRECRGYLWL